MKSDHLVDDLEARGWRAAVVPARRLADLRAEIERRRSEVAPEVMEVVERNLDFAPPAALPAPRSVIVVAVPHACARVTVVVDGEELAVPIPTTYCHHADIQTQVAATLTAGLAPAGLSAVLARLPEKLLAVCAGLARYGRNNIVYVDGHGSFVELAACVSDLPAGADPWTGMRSLPRCDSCEACRRACPTGAIGDDRFLLHGERCLTLHNESERPFAEWIDPAWHHCLVGCLRCQRCCPEDRRRARRGRRDGRLRRARDRPAGRRRRSRPARARAAAAREAGRPRAAGLRRRVPGRGPGAQPAGAARRPLIAPTGRKTGARRRGRGGERRCRRRRLLPGGVEQPSDDGETTARGLHGYRPDSQGLVGDLREGLGRPDRGGPHHGRPGHLHAGHPDRSPDRRPVSHDPAARPRGPQGRGWRRVRLFRPHRRLLRRLPAVPGHRPLLRRRGGAAAGAARDPQHGRPRVRRLSVRPRPDRGDRRGRLPARRSGSTGRSSWSTGGSP